MAGITSLGCFLPRLRLARATIAEAMGWLGQGKARVKGEIATCNWDEDSLTLGVEAARIALAGAPSSDLDSLVFASTTAPFADHANGVILATALGLNTSLRVSDTGGSQRAGTSALAAALAAADRGTPCLVVASDQRLARPGSPQELQYGHGATAALVGGGAGLAEFVGAEHLAADFVDHYRESGASFDYALEDRWVREAGWNPLVSQTVGRLLGRLGLQAAQIDRVVLACPAATARGVLKATGLRAEALVPDRTGEFGDIGCGHPLLLLATALESAAAGEHVLVIGFGQGVDAILLRATGQGQAGGFGLAEAAAARREETHYTRFLSHQGLLPVEFGMRAERDNRTAQTVAWRKHEVVTGFTGGRCRQCGALQFPLSRVCVAPDCRETDTQEPLRLAELPARIKTFTEDWLAYSARPPLVYGNAQFEAGGNVFMEFTDFAPGEARVGGPVRFMFRIKDLDSRRGFRRYFWKAAPGLER
ncbi:MAG: 3-hydroxy-3-methylglutaryl CoA synthase [Steroidobacteraceae bacterium]